MSWRLCFGERILQPLSSFASIRPLARSHHEKLNGSGYPDRRAGDGIPLLVRGLPEPAAAAFEVL